MPGEVEVSQDEIEHQIEVCEWLIADQQESRREIRTQNFLLSKYFERA